MYVIFPGSSKVLDDSQFKSSPSMPHSSTENDNIMLITNNSGVKQAYRVVQRPVKHYKSKPYCTVCTRSVSDINVKTTTYRGNLCCTSCFYFHKKRLYRGFDDFLCPGNGMYMC